MSVNRWEDLRVERSAVLAVERSIIDHTDLVVAHPVSDFGIDLIAFTPAPFSAVPIQVKGASTGLSVHEQYADQRIILAYVVSPRSDHPLVAIMSGEDAWNLPFEYVERGGRASDHAHGNGGYRFPSVTKLLRAMLEERAASAERWSKLVEESAIRDKPHSG